jgi:D-alanyl-D-alanine carboxypeptidase (penicillin-binding protein 5/6)
MPPYRRDPMNRRSRGAASADLPPMPEPTTSGARPLASALVAVRLWLLAAVVACTAALGAIAAQPAAAAAPTVTAPSAAVIEASTGTVVYAKAGNVQHGMASTTKLMTALVALDTEPLSTVMTAIDYVAGAAETKINLVAGEKMTLADLVRSMMLPSANDAAATVAVRTGGTKAKFVAMMNAKAKELGLTRTHFTNPVGLDATTHRTTAIELAKIGVAAHNNPFIRATVKRKRITLASGDTPRTLINRNTVLGDALPGGGVIDGMKTGHTTAAGYSLVGSATRGGVTVVSTVLAEPSEDARDADTLRLLRWASQLFVKKTLVKDRQRVTTVPVLHGKLPAVTAVATGALVKVVARGAKVTLTPSSMSPGLEAPVAAGTKVGVAKVSVNGKVVDTVPLVARVAVEKESTLAAIAGGFGDHWKGILFALLLVSVGTLTLVRASRANRPNSRARTTAAPEPTERTTAP